MRALMTTFIRIPSFAPVRRPVLSAARGWRSASALVAAVAALPVLVVLLSWSTLELEVWQHLVDTVLFDLVRNTVFLTLSVGIGVFVLGVGMAWLVVMHEFPGRAVFDWALMLPLAIPPYVLAFVFLGLLDYGGPVQLAVQSLFGFGHWYPEVRSDWGVATVMVLVFYPYVYMLARAAFIGQGRSVMEAARTLGLTPRRAFLRVALPMARPAVVAGVALAVMETLADFGAVAVFNYDTFTTAIYKAWFGLFNLQAAAQLASLLLVFVFGLLLAEYTLRGRARYHSDARSARVRRQRLRGGRAWLASAAAGTVVGLGFVIPTIQLSVWAWDAAAQDLDARYWQLLTHTVSLGAIAASLIIVGALILSYTRRHFPDPATAVAVRLSTLGYALPGSVLAVGIMVAFAWLDARLAALSQAWFGGAATTVLVGSVAALILAYVARFMAAGFGPVDAAMERIKPSIHEAARSLGEGHWGVVRRVYLPMLRPGILTGALLAFIEVMKEMPATLLLRPFGWDTFAVRIYEMTSEGYWERAALPAVTLVIAGLIPVILLVRRSARA